MDLDLDHEGWTESNKLKNDMFASKFVLGHKSIFRPFYSIRERSSIMSAHFWEGGGSEPK